MKEEIMEKIKTEKELKEEIKKLIEEKIGSIPIDLTDYTRKLMLLHELKAKLKTFQERNAEFKQIIEDVDLELMLTDIKDIRGKKVELSDEFMELISFWWDKQSKRILQELK